MARNQRKAVRGGIGMFDVNSDEESDVEISAVLDSSTGLADLFYKHVVHKKENLPDPPVAIREASELQGLPNIIPEQEENKGRRYQVTFLCSGFTIG
jgi:hypothetical protein